MAETSPALLQRDLTSQILDSAIEVHRVLGPGLLESAYRSCLETELCMRGLKVDAEIPVPLTYKGRPVECAFRLDLLVNDSVVVELKAVERLLPIHEAQVLTYLKLCKRHIGLLFNFNSTRLMKGFRRLVR